MDYVNIMGFWYSFFLWFAQLCIGLFTSAYGLHLMIEESRISMSTEDQTSLRSEQDE